VEQAVGTHALGVIGNEHDVAFRQQRLDAAKQRPLDFRRQRIAHFAVDPQHLVGVPVLGAADEPFLHGRRPRWIDDHGRAVDSRTVQFVQQHGAVDVLAHDASQERTGI
jgi:hypothetical protein